MRFCMITTFYPPHHFGGDAIFTYRLSHLLADRGHEVEVFHSEDAFRALGGVDAGKGYPEHPRVKRTALRSRLGAVDVLAVQQLGRPAAHAGVLGGLFEAGRFDVVHFHNASLMGAPSLLAKCKQTDAVSLYTLHEHWLVCPMHVLWRFDREPCEKQTCVRCQLKGRRPPQLWRYTDLRDRSIAAVDAVLAPSRFTLEKHRELGLRVEPRLLPHFVPEPAHAASNVESPSRPYFLFAGRLERLKGAADAIDAMRAVPDADLVVAGDGAERTNLETRAQGMPNVRFVGRLGPGELSALLVSARAALVPSLCYEVFGLSAVEAFACGTPAVLRDRGSLTELARESGAALTFSTEDELVAALRRMLDDEQHRNELARRARAAYLEHWHPEVHLARYLQIVDELKSQKSARRAAAGPRGRAGSVPS
jgi:glycosyltransferase involved in cell wall biosynthesis